MTSFSGGLDVRTGGAGPASNTTLPLDSWNVIGFPLGLLTSLPGKCTWLVPDLSCLVVGRAAIMLRTDHMQDCHYQMTTF